jgi:hypothetical protein
MSIQHLALLVGLSTSSLERSPQSNILQERFSTSNSVQPFDSNQRTSSGQGHGSWTYRPAETPGSNNPDIAQEPDANPVELAVLGLAGALGLSRRLRRLVLHQLGWRQRRHRYAGRQARFR